MRVLMASWGVDGQVPIEIGVARRLVDAGHEVMLLREPTMGPAASAFGAHFTPGTAATAVEDDIADWARRTPLTLFPRLLKRLIIGPSARYAADVRTVAEHGGFDAAVIDIALMGAQAATERASPYRLRSPCPKPTSVPHRDRPPSASATHRVPAT